MTGLDRSGARPGEQHLALLRMKVPTPSPQAARQATGARMVAGPSSLSVICTPIAQLRPGRRKPIVTGFVQIVAERAWPRMKGTLVASKAVAGARLVMTESAARPASQRPGSS